MRRRYQKDASNSTDAMLQRWASSHRQREASPSREANGKQRIASRRLIYQKDGEGVESVWRGPNYDMLPLKITLSGHNGMRSAFMGTFHRGGEITPEGVPIYVSDPPFRRYMFRTGVSGRWAVTSIRNNFTESGSVIYSTSASESPTNLRWMVKLSDKHVLDPNVMCVAHGNDRDSQLYMPEAAFQGETISLSGTESDLTSSTSNATQEPGMYLQDEGIRNTIDPLTGARRILSGEEQTKALVDYIEDIIIYIVDVLIIFQNLGIMMTRLTVEDIRRVAIQHITFKRVVYSLFSVLAWYIYRTGIELYALQTDDGSFYSEMAKAIRLQREGRMKINIFSQPLEEDRNGNITIGCRDKVLFIGSQRTATDAIDRLFHLSVGNHEYRTLRDFTWRKGDREVLKQHDIFTGGCHHDVRSILSVCPNAHYVYQTRNLRDWLESYLAWGFVQRHYLMKNRYRKLPWILKKYIFPRLYALADDLTYGCGMPKLTRIDAIAVLHKRIEYEATIGKIFHMILAPTENSLSTQKMEDNSTLDPKLLVWEASFDHKAWIPLYNFINYSFNAFESSHLRFPAPPFALDFFEKHDTKGLARPGYPPMTAYRCIRYAAGLLADTVLKAEAAIIDQHCERWPKFCSESVLFHDHKNLDSNTMTVAERLSYKLDDNKVYSVCHKLHDYNEVDHHEVDEFLQDHEILRSLAAKHRVDLPPR